MELLHMIINWLVDIVGAMGYLGIFILMFLESSFFPFPSEVVMVPAGYLAYLGKMNLFLVILFGILGSLLGAWFNYLLAHHFGRKFLEKFIKVDKLDKLDIFFDKHGHISTFTGRLIPVVRQYISFPAGLSKMNAWKFSFYTTIGAGIWVSILAFLGYFLGQNQELIKAYIKEITIVLLTFVFIIVLIYYLFTSCKNKG